MGLAKNSFTAAEKDAANAKAAKESATKLYAAKANSAYAAAVKVHCDAEAQHAKAVQLIGHGHHAKNSCAPYTKIGVAKDCCRTNGAGVGSVKNNGAAHPANCEAACSANQKCKYFSHSLKWKNCVLCSSCKWSGAPGNGQYYTSW